MRSEASGVEVVRGGLVEARHPVNVVVADASGRMIASLGDAALRTYYRSSAKPIQALPLVEEGVPDRFGLSQAEVALCCASHEGEPEHVAGARSILAKAGLTEAVLRCGPHPPFSHSAAQALAARGEGPGRIHNNCSGKHAGMAALAVACGWPTEDYHLVNHPVQQRMLAEVMRWSQLPKEAIDIAVDGCGVACFGMPLRDMAASFARFAAAAERGESAGVIVGAMIDNPFMVAGTGRVCTEAMRAAEGRVFLKLGAEGLYCGGIPERGWGFVVKVGDGARRAVDVAVVRVLDLLGLLESRGREALRHHARPALTNTLGEVVGESRAAFDMDIPRG